jgi:hypothetical protein
MLGVNRPFNCEFLSSPLRTTPSKAVALAPSELVGVVETVRARLAYDCQLGSGSVGFRRKISAQSL